MHHGEISEEVFKAIMRNFYVDDFLSSYPTTEKARAVRKELTEVLKGGGFELTKWKCTHPEA